MSDVLTSILDMVNELPDIDTTYLYSLFHSDEFLNSFDSIVSFIAFFVPLSAVVPALILDFSITAFHIAWSLLLRLKSFLPNMSN